MEYTYQGLDKDLEIAKEDTYSTDLDRFGPLDCQFLRQIEGGDIPNCEPVSLNSFYSRTFCTKRGMWAIVTAGWTTALADWIGGRTAIEIMAGRGWLTRALSEHGVNIIATDDYSWDDTHDATEPVCKVEQMDAEEVALTHLDREVLICSWPHSTEPFQKICRLWLSEGKSVVYIGEDNGGCCVREDFELRLERLEIDMPQWEGMHDCVYEVLERGEDDE